MDDSYWIYFNGMASRKQTSWMEQQWPQYCEKNGFEPSSCENQISYKSSNNETGRLAFAQEKVAIWIHISFLPIQKEIKQLIEMVLQALLCSCQDGKFYCRPLNKWFVSQFP